MQTQNSFSCFIFGAGTLPVQSAQVLLQHGHEIYGIISPDAELGHWAQQHNIPYLTPNDDFIAAIRRQSFDYLFSIVNDLILPQELIDAPHQFAINYHDAPLPKYAGTHATTWAILNQETRHAVTWHRVTEQIDAGDILKQEFFDIAPDETAVTLNIKCYEAAIRSFTALVDDLAHDQATSTPQNLAERSYFARYLRPPANCVIDWNQEAHRIEALVRGLDFGPYPNPLGRPKFLIGADCLVAAKLDVLDVNSQARPGTITTITPDALTIATATRDVDLCQATTLDGQSFPLAELVTRFGLREGDHLDSPAPDLARRLTDSDAQICRHEPFWVKRLAGLQPVAWPYASQSAPSQTTTRYANLSMSTPAAATGDFLLAAFAAYLARLNDIYRFDLAFRHPDLGQTVDGLDAFFASHIPLRVDLDEAQTFEAAQQVVRAEVALLKKRKTYARDVAARYPDLEPGPELQGDSALPVAVEQLDRVERLSPAPGAYLTLGIAADGSACRWTYNTNMLRQEDIERMMRHFETFLHSILTQPEQPLAHLPLLTEAERHQLLVEWNNTRINYPQDKCLHQLFEAQVEKTPNATALIFPQANQQNKNSAIRNPQSAIQLTYRALNQRANQLAHYLRQLGVGPEVLVGICVERSLEMVVGLLGILKAGGAYVPLDPAYPKERLAFMLSDTQVPVLLTQAKLGPELPEQKARLVCLDADWEVMAQESEANPVSGVIVENLAYVIYTSGSTGRPKGVQIGHRSLVNFLQAMRVSPGLTAQDLLLAVTTLSFDIAALELYLPLLVGGQVVLASREVASDGGQLLALLEKCGATVMQATPATWRMLLAAGWVGNDQLKMLCGGEALSEELARQLLKRGTSLWNLYGPTETTIWSSIYKVEAGWPVDGTPEAVEPIGRPIANTEMYILDRHLQPVPIGVPGELYIGGAGLARGYLNRPELTEEKFIPSPCPPSITPGGEEEKGGARLYKTGDLVRYRPDGNIEFLGRLDHQVKIRGFRIELGEIEGVLGQHQAVRETVTIVREDQPGNKRLVAYVVPQEGSVVKTNELRRFLAETLPNYMVPSAFVTLEALPLTPNGKVDRHALPAPDTTRVGLEAGFVPARTPTEEALTKIWADVLKLEKVGIYDNFFELGGHSLLGTQIISRLHELFQVNLFLRNLFEEPTVVDLAERIETIRWAAQTLQAPLGVAVNDLEEGDL